MTLPFLVVAGVGANLLVCDWLEVITLNWKAVYNVNRNQLQAALNQYLEVFKPGVDYEFLQIQLYHQNFAKHTQFCMP